MYVEFFSPPRMNMRTANLHAVPPSTLCAFILDHAQHKRKSFALFCARGDEKQWNRYVRGLCVDERPSYTQISELFARCFPFKFAHRPPLLVLRILCTLQLLWWASFRFLLDDRTISRSQALICLTDNRWGSSMLILIHLFHAALFFLFVLLIQST